MELNMKTIGIRIKERRTELQLKQNDIKNLVGISSGNLSEIENGNRTPSMITLYRLSEILDCSIDWIVKGQSPNSENSTISPKGEKSTNLLNQFEKLSEEDKDDILEQIEYKLFKSEKHKKGTAKSSLSRDKVLNHETA